MARIRLYSIKKPNRKRIEVSANFVLNSENLSSLRIRRQNEERRYIDSLEKAKSISICQSLLDSVETYPNHIEIALKENINNISQDENSEDIYSLCISSLSYSSEDEIYYTKIYKSKNGKNYSIKPLNIIFRLPELFQLFAVAAMSGSISVTEENYYKLIFVALKSILMIVPKFKVELTETATMLAYNLYKNFGLDEVDIKKVQEMLQAKQNYDIKNFDQDISLLEKYKCIERISSNKSDEQCIRLIEKINLRSFNM